MLWRTIHRAGG